jgi:hypothetical protein|tara:strand:- start:2046 stop:2246 length:201 start_codon:yes stop_codon:yes gene_type:complete
VFSEVFRLQADLDLPFRVVPARRERGEDDAEDRCESHSSLPCHPVVPEVRDDLPEPDPYLSDTIAT